MLKFVLLLSVVAIAVYAVPGGWEDASLDDEVVAAANHATNTLSKRLTGRYQHRLAKIVKAEQQVVTSMKYKLDMIIGKTNCNKYNLKSEDAADCDFQDQTNTYLKCQVLVYDNLKGERNVKTIVCKPASKTDL